MSWRICSIKDKFCPVLHCHAVLVACCAIVMLYHMLLSGMCSGSGVRVRSTGFRNSETPEQKPAASWLCTMQQHWYYITCSA